MTRYSLEKPGLALTPRSSKNRNIKPAYEVSQGLERKDCDSSKVSRSRGERSGSVQRRAPIRSDYQQRKRNGSATNGKNHKRLRDTDASQSFSTWKYKELIQDNLTMALVDEFHPDGCLLFENWCQIEAKLARIVADRRAAVPLGPHPLLDSSLVIRGHRVIRCKDGFSKIFLEDCIKQLADAWDGLRIKLVHASEIPSPSQAVPEVVQEQGVKDLEPPGGQHAENAKAITQNKVAPQAQFNGVQQTEVNSFGWIIPRGAQFSYAAILKIKNGFLKKSKGQNVQFVVNDGGKSWRVTVGKDFRVRITQDIPVQTEVAGAKVADASAVRETAEKTLQTEDLNQKENVEPADKMDPSAWVLPQGAELSNKGILFIQKHLQKPTSKGRFLFRDGNKTWKILHYDNQSVRIVPHSKKVQNAKDINKKYHKKGQRM
ncbi:uncharacterized protein LOC120284927 [Drosophila simulans]|uniref:GD17615 n=1 Tax=Drosophila simulans TaxID=7240 RepID=B4R0U4_DROSI|nr:uncharacterized protein LOC120284927 [Drosophila simulans]EDX14915.1 GD17615 [Drosophila simulans]